MNTHNIDFLTKVILMNTHNMNFLAKAILMNTHNIGFYGKCRKSVMTGKLSGTITIAEKLPNGEIWFPHCALGHTKQQHCRKNNFTTCITKFTWIQLKLIICTHHGHHPLLLT